jgi:hypothetical protein
MYRASAKQRLGRLTTIAESRVRPPKVVRAGPGDLEDGTTDQGPADLERSFVGPS